MRDREAVARELLAVRCIRGEPAALDELVRTWEARLLYYIRRIVDHDADAQDVLQKTWLRALTGFARLEDPRNLAAWLYTIARNAAYSHVKSRKEYEPLDDHAEAVEEEIEFEDAEAVHRGLLALSRPHREVLTLFFLDDLSVAEVADVLSVSPGTVKSRLHYARLALRAAIGGPHD